MNQQQNDKQEMKQHENNKSAKSPDFFLSRLSKKALSKVLYNYEDQDKKLSEFPTLESTREIFIKEISF